jgi:long-chain fatty acid transport protein
MADTRARTRSAAASLATLCLACLPTAPARAGALDNSSVGARAIAMGSAFTGLANDASAVYFNPAGLAFLAAGTQVDAYGYLSFTGFEYENAGRRFESSETFPVPGLFVGHRSGRLGLGFGAYVPFGGGGTAYPDFMGAGIELKNTAGIVAVGPAVAWALSPGLAVGGGVALHYGVLDSRAPLPIPGPVPTIADYSSDYRSVSGWGWNLGVLYKPAPVLSLGLNVSGPSDESMDGEETMRIDAFGIETTSASTVELGTPWYVSAGLGYEPRPGLTLAVSACWMGWGSETEVVITHAAGPDTRVPTHYEDSWRVALGAEYVASRRLSLRAGLKYVPGATQEGYLVPSANDVDVWVASLGAGVRLGKRLELQLAAYHVSGRRTEQGRESFDQDHTMAVLGLRWGP